MEWICKGFSEIDENAVKSYCAIHGISPDLNLGDITTADLRKFLFADVIFGGTPCQDFSIAGKKAGNMYRCEDCGAEYNPLTVSWRQRDECPECGSRRISGTRSSLTVKYLEAVRTVLPKFGIFENVKNLVCGQFRETFDLFVKEIESYGYNCYWKVLNARDYGIPQNRERVYLVFVKRDQDNGKFLFPDPKPPKFMLIDVCDDRVDERFYLKGKKVELLKENLIDSGLNQIGYINGYNGDANRIYAPECARTLKAEAGGGGAKTGWYAMQAAIDKSMNGTRIIENANCIAAREDRGVSNRKAEGTAIMELLRPEASYCIDANYHKGGCNGTERLEKKRSRQLICDSIGVRKLTPKECFRLFGFDDADYDRVAEKGVSMTQQYRQTGNSIVVDVLHEIMSSLRHAMPWLFGERPVVVSLFSGIGAFEKALTKLGRPMEHDWDWEAEERRKERCL